MLDRFIPTFFFVDKEITRRYGLLSGLLQGNEIVSNTPLPDAKNFFSMLRSELESTILPESFNKSAKAFVV